LNRGSLLLHILRQDVPRREIILHLLKCRQRRLLIIRNSLVVLSLV
jgi:hypothetical protein